MTLNTSIRALRLLPLAALLFSLGQPALATTTQIRSFEYDALGRMTKEIDANGKTTVYTYDANGNRLTRTDALNRTTRYSYDALNRLSSMTDPAGGITSFSYDANDNLVSVKDPRGLITSYTYNGLGDLLKQVSPDTATTSFTYDAAGNQKTRVDARSKTATSTYDALGRVTSIAYGDQTHSFTWDSGSNGIGRLSQFTDLSGTTAFSYDPQGRVIGKSTTFASVGGVAGTRTLAYQYDSSGRLTQITYPSGNKIGYSYDSNGRINALSLNGTGFISNVSYQPFGGIKGWSWANGTMHQRSYDLNGRLTYLQHGNDYSKSYTWDNANRISQQTDQLYATRTQVYGYDTLDRLSNTTRNTTSEAYQYDASGNRTKLTVGSNSTTNTIASDSNRVTALSGASSKSYSYDASGNLTSDGSYKYVYDNVGRLRQMTTLAGASITALIYNAQGHLAIKTNYSKPAQFVYDEAGHLVGEYADPATKNPTQETVWLGDTPVATLQPIAGSLATPTLYYVFADHLDTPRRIVEPSSKKTVWYWEGEAFGNTYPDEDPDKDSVKLTYNLRYPGQYYLRDMGWFHNWHRDYSPGLGRYLQSDPIGLQGGINTYAYVNSVPTLLIDPKGLSGYFPWEPSPDWPAPPALTPPPTPVPCVCPTPPTAPPGVCVGNNIDIAKDYPATNPGSWLGFYENVKNFGPWDYKRRGKKYEDFGNFNFGATAATMGIPAYIAQNGAGIYQQWRGAKTAGKGTPLLVWPYGDDPSDGIQISRGYQYAKCSCKDRQP